MTSFVSEPILISEFKPFRDERGSFQKVFRTDSLARYGFTGSFRESFISISEPGVLRGMHFQAPPSDHWKLVMATAGEIFDVCVDLRRETPGRLKSVVLSESSGSSLLIPPGFAHGFATKGNRPATVLYLTSTEHDPKSDTGIRYDSIGFDWEKAVGRSDFIVSKRDLEFLKFSELKSPW